MAIHIYNSLTRKKEEFVPLRKNRVYMYVCGPTVYDESHIGHARGAFVFDVIRNYFAYRGFKVKYVRNVTDVDDKIIERARRLAGADGDLKKTVREIAGTYLKKYNKDMKALGLSEPDIAPKATEHIKDMLRVIKALLEKGYAYEADGDVYFRVRNFKGYGRLSHQSIKMMESGARIHPGERKEDPLDFALWKKAKEGEPSWKVDSLAGRPGWHIECSAMSMKHLGDTFDIHGGGLDLIFPHHENEVAQSEAYSGGTFARYWIHNGLLTINGQKMAKSLGNYLSISDFLAKYKDPDILKIFFLSAHYRGPVDFTEENITAAKTAKERFTVFFDRVAEIRAKSPVDKRVKRGKREGPVADKLRSDFERAMDDDFNTAAALAALFEAVKEGNTLIDAEGDAGEKAPVLNKLKERIEALGTKVLGLSFSRETAPAGLKQSVEDKLRIRDEARKNGDYGRADKIREELLQEGVIIEDTAAGTKWRLK